MKDLALAAMGELSAQDVRDRFATARRSGTARWLWPDIAVEDWRQAMTAIAAVAGEMLAGDGQAVLDGAKASAFGIAGFVSGMGPLLGYWLEQGRLAAAPDVREAFALHLAHNRARNAMLCDRARQAVEALAAASITPMIVKGMHTALVYFPEPGARALSDIDILIPPDAIEASAAVLRALGYEPCLRRSRPYACDWTLAGMRQEPRTLAFTHRDDPWQLDVQASLNRLLRIGREVELNHLLPASPLGLWPCSSAARVLGQPLLALHLAAHISQEMLSVTLLRLVELALVLRRDSASGALDWDEFLAGARNIGGGRMVYAALYFCEQLAPGTVPPPVLAACRADAPARLRRVLAQLTPATATPLGRRHSLRERFMWAKGFGDHVRQLRWELGLDGSGKPLREALYSCGTKLWALSRRQYGA